MVPNSPPSKLPFAGKQLMFSLMLYFLNEMGGSL